jgi:hypothetical protein
LFSDLKSVESRGKQKITCTLEFDEYDSVAVKSQDRMLNATLADREQSEAEGGSSGTGKKKKSAVVLPAQPLVADKTRRRLGDLEERYAEQ